MYLNCKQINITELIKEVYFSKYTLQIDISILYYIDDPSFKGNIGMNINKPQHKRLMFIIDMLVYTVCVYATGFGKTLYVCTNIEIHFIVYYNSHTHALSRHSNKTATDKQVWFYKWPFANPVKS